MWQKSWRWRPSGPGEYARVCSKSWGSPQLSRQTSRVPLNQRTMAKNLEVEAALEIRSQPQHLWGGGGNWGFEDWRVWGHSGVHREAALGSGAVRPLPQVIWGTCWPRHIVARSGPRTFSFPSRSDKIVRWASRNVTNEPCGSYGSVSTTWQSSADEDHLWGRIESSPPSRRQHRHFCNSRFCLLDVSRVPFRHMEDRTSLPLLGLGIICYPAMGTWYTVWLFSCRVMYLQCIYLVPAACSLLLLSSGALDGCATIYLSISSWGTFEFFPIFLVLMNEAIMWWRIFALRLLLAGNGFLPVILKASCGLTPDVGHPDFH